MARAVATKQQINLFRERTDSTPTDNQYSDRLLKYIPAEVITLYVALTSTVATMNAPPKWLPWAVAGFCLVAVVVHLKSLKEVIPTTQVIIAGVSFIVWIFALPNGPFTQFDWYEQVYGALLLPAYTFLVARIVPA